MRVTTKVGAAIAICAAVGVVATTLPASAAAGWTTGKPVMIVGQGSDTNYDVMTKLDALYNNAPGCGVIANPGVSIGTADLGSCIDPATGKVATPDANDAMYLNPQHDQVNEAFPVGSGSGIKLLVNQGGAGVPQVDFARSSRGPGTDAKTTKFVAFARDGVTWFHFTKAAGKFTPSAQITNLTQQQLLDVFTGKTTNWKDISSLETVRVTKYVVKPVYRKDPKTGRFVKVFKKDAKTGKVVPVTSVVKTYVNQQKTITGGDAPIKLYIAQPGSGTLSTWNSFLGIGTGSNAYPTGDAAPKSIFENNANPIVDNGDAANAIFFFSTGRYAQSVGKAGQLVGNSTGRPNYTDAIGKIAGIAPTPDTIGGKDFPGFRNLYFVTNDPVKANVANYLDPINGFLCGTKSETVKNAQGATFRSVIEKTIASEGFVPIVKKTITDGAATGSSYCEVSRVS